MSENYTAEDFAGASFARHRDGGKAVRFDAATDGPPWQIGMLGKSTDEYMARNGWVPVVESRVTEGTLRHVEERAERKRQKLIAHIASVEAAVRDRNRTIEELRAARKEDSCRESAAHDRVVTLLDTKETLERTIRELRHDLKVALAEVADLGDENDRLERILQSPLSLKDMEVAWEAAEVPTEDTPIREGDVVIVRHGGGFAVEPADRILSGQTHGRERILSRAPQRETWADLADVLADSPPWVEAWSAGESARWLHERGVRLTGGDDDE